MSRYGPELDQALDVLTTLTTLTTLTLRTSGAGRNAGSETGVHARQRPRLSGKYCKWHSRSSCSRVFKHRSALMTKRRLANRFRSPHIRSERPAQSSPVPGAPGRSGHRADPREVLGLARLGTFAMLRNHIATNSGSVLLPSNPSRCPTSPPPSLPKETPKGMSVLRASRSGTAYIVRESNPCRVDGNDA